MTVPSQPEERFSWDFDLPSSPFWQAVGWKPARMFFVCFSQTEIESMDLARKPAPSQAGKYDLLLKEYEAASKALGSADSNYEKWYNLAMGRATLLPLLGRGEEGDAILKEMLAKTDPTGKPQIATMHNLASRLAERGDYAEAEKLVLKLVPLEEIEPKLGPHSPQALSLLRLLTEVRYRLGKSELAKESFQRLVKLTGEAKETRFRKYEADEKEQNDELIQKLGIEAWTK
ncbi:hypothetical protein LTR95_010779 [Oleoguttula sp. CCFEE 5521]